MSQDSNVTKMDDLKHEVTSEIKDEIHDEDLSEEDAESGEFQESFDAVLEGMGLPYNPDNELLPDLPAYRPSFRKVESSCAQVFEEAATLIEESDYSDDCTKQLHESIMEKKNLQYPEAKKIAFFGASGVGEFGLSSSS